MTLYNFHDDFSGSLSGDWTLSGADTEHFITGGGTANLQFTDSFTLGGAALSIQSKTLGHIYTGYIKFKLLLPDHFYTVGGGFGSGIVNVHAGLRMDYLSTHDIYQAGLTLTKNGNNPSNLWTGNSLEGSGSSSYTYDPTRPYFKWESDGTDMFFYDSVDGLGYSLMHTSIGGGVALAGIHSVYLWAQWIPPVLAGQNIGDAIDFTISMDELDVEYWLDSIDKSKIIMWNDLVLPYRPNLTGRNLGAKATFSPRR